jgi:hypothetical protein
MGEGEVCKECKNKTIVVVTKIIRREDDQERIRFWLRCFFCLQKVVVDGITILIIIGEELSSPE